MKVSNVVSQDINCDENNIFGKRKNPTTCGLRHIMEIKERLGLDSFKSNSARRTVQKRKASRRKRIVRRTINSKHVSTFASEYNKSKEPAEVTTYLDPHKRSNKTVKIVSETPSRSSELDMRQARFDVFKFTINSRKAALDENTDDNLMSALLMKLGAKKVKNKAIPYPKFKETARLKKEVEKKEIKLHNLSGRNHREPSNRKNQKLRGGDIQIKMGMFDGGMLRLSKYDVEKFRRAN